MSCAAARLVRMDDRGGRAVAAREARGRHPMAELAVAARAQPPVERAQALEHLAPDAEIDGRRPAPGEEPLRGKLAQEVERQGQAAHA